LEKIRSRQVLLDELDESMTITGYLSLQAPYSPATDKACQWLILNFKGATASVERAGKKGAIPVEKLQPGDVVNRIYDFPPTLAKLTKVSPALLDNLQKRGFTKFQIEEEVHSATSPRQLTREHQEKVAEASVFIEMVEASVATHKEASGAVENMLDDARLGKINAEQVGSYVNQICEDGKGEALTAMASLQASDQTYAHCVEVGAIFQTAYLEICRYTGNKNIFTDLNQMTLAAFMHDFGKAKVPKEILDSTTRFERDSKEMNLMQSHPRFGAELLTDMGLPNYVINMAHYHHTKMDAGMKSSYPPADYGDVIFETRLLALVDVYQALIGKRKYKRAWTPPETIRYLASLSEIEFEESLYQHFVNALGKFPKSSLVQLSDLRTGFVMNVPEDKNLLERPQVAVVLDKDGEHFEHSELVDLSVELDLRIIKELDAQAVFGQHALDVFCRINVS